MWFYYPRISEYISYFSWAVRWVICIWCIAPHRLVPRLDTPVAMLGRWYLQLPSSLAFLAVPACANWPPGLTMIPAMSFWLNWVEQSLGTYGYHLKPPLWFATQSERTTSFKTFCPETRQTYLSYLQRGGFLAAVSPELSTGICALTISRSLTDLSTIPLKDKLHCYWVRDTVWRGATHFPPWRESDDNKWGPIVDCHLGSATVDSRHWGPDTLHTPGQSGDPTVYITLGNPFPGPIRLPWDNHDAPVLLSVTWKMFISADLTNIYVPGVHLQSDLGIYFSSILCLWNHTRCLRCFALNVQTEMRIGVEQLLLTTPTHWKQNVFCKMVTTNYKTKHNKTMFHLIFFVMWCILNTMKIRNDINMSWQYWKYI